MGIALENMGWGCLSLQSKKPDGIYFPILYTEYLKKISKSFSTLTPVSGISQSTDLGTSDASQSLKSKIGKVQDGQTLFSQEALLKEAKLCIGVHRGGHSHAWDDSLPSPKPPRCLTKVSSSSPLGFCDFMDLHSLPWSHIISISISEWYLALEGFFGSLDSVPAKQMCLQVPTRVRTQVHLGKVMEFPNISKDLPPSVNLPNEWLPQHTV